MSDQNGPSTGDIADSFKQDENIRRQNGNHSSQQGGSGCLILAGALLAVGAAGTYALVNSVTSNNEEKPEPKTEQVELAFADKGIIREVAPEVFAK